MKPLTDRQLQIMRLMAEGKTAKQVAKLLGRSPSTINHTIDAVAVKMGLEGRKIIKMVDMLERRPAQRVEKTQRDERRTA